MARNQRLNATLTIGSVLERSVGRNLNLVRRGLDRVNDEIGELTARRRDMERQRRELERQGRSVEDLDREYEELGRTLDDLRRRQERYERAAAAARGASRNFGRAVSEVGRFARRAAVTVGAAGAAIVALTNSTASLGDEVAKTADNLGIGVEAFQELRYAAERSGMNVSQFDSSMTAFTRRLGQAAEGTGQAGRALDQLGLSAQDLIDLEPEEALGIIADRMQAIESPAERAAIAADLFSRQGIGMVNMLRDGSEGLEQLRADARATGYVLSEEAARDAEAYQDALLDTQLSIQGLKNTIGVELMPVVQNAMERFGAYMRENRDEVQAFGAALAEGLERAIPIVGEVATGLGRVAEQVGAVTARLAEMVGGWENFGAIVGGIFASRAILAVGAFVGSVVKLGGALASLAAPAVLPAVAGAIRAIGAALWANPIGLAVGAIAGAAILIARNWESIEPRVRAVLDAIGEGFTWLWENAAQPVIEALRSAGDGIVSAWQAVQTGVGAALDALGEAFRRVWAWIEPVVDALRWVGENGGALLDRLGNAERTTRTDANGNQREVGPTGAIVGRAIGGNFPAGPVLVGERGPELRYENRSGFIAHHRALERMADYAQQAAGGLAAAGQQAAQQVAQVTQNITINADGLSAEALIDEIERRRQAAERGALFDGAAGWGQYGGAHG